MRECGVLLPITSLPSPYGIGCFSKEAYDFVDELVDAGQECWQILPMGPTGCGDSPYQTFSAFAGNPYFIDLETLIEEGLLTQEDCDEADFGGDETSVDYGLIYQNRYPVLRKAFERWKTALADAGKDPQDEVYDLWRETREYCLFTAIKRSFGDIPWMDWDDDIRLCRPEALERYRTELADDTLFYEFLQLEFQDQWKKLKAYANSKGISIIGDMPIYVAMDSADAWSQPELFMFDEDKRPISVAGCPPDAFSETGQLWGNPIYRWDYHEKTGYEWWIRRMAYGFTLFDRVRIDHFRGFAGYYSIPAGDETALNGTWEKGPGYPFFRKMKETFGDLPIIAEDLGTLTPDVPELLKECGFPGMKVLQFAFNSWEKNTYLPMFYDKDYVVYTGTHDNDTIKGWLRDLSPEDKKFLLDYLGAEDLPDDDIPWKVIRLALSSVADLAIIPLADYLGHGSEARINTPATVGINWRWRMKKGEFDEDIRTRCRHICELYARTAEGTEDVKEPEEEEATTLKL